MIPYITDDEALIKDLNRSLIPSPPIKFVRILTVFLEPLIDNFESLHIGFEERVVVIRKILIGFIV